MSRRRNNIDCPREPIGFSREEAARFIGVSATSFDKLVETGLMPRARAVLSRKVWHVGELEKAFLLLPSVGKCAVDADDEETAWSPGRLVA